MKSEETVFEATYRHYLRRIGGIAPAAVAAGIGASLEADVLRIRFFDGVYRVSAGGIAGEDGRRPDFDVCVILSRYVLMGPADPPGGGDWVSFRNLKDAGPLTVYFQNEVERSIAVQFAGRADDLKGAATRLGGYPPALDVACDVSIRFDALPKVPLIVLFNDADPEFPAACSVLFESRAEAYLDAECLAMLGRQLFARLKKAAV